MRFRHAEESKIENPLVTSLVLSSRDFSSTYMELLSVMGRRKIANISRVLQCVVFIFKFTWNAIETGFEVEVRSD